MKPVFFASIFCLFAVGGNAQTTHPKIRFSTDLENVLFRSQPSQKGEKQGYLYPNEPAFWTGKSSEKAEIIEIRGQKKPFHWFETEKGWVYGGCVWPAIFDFSGDEIFQDEASRRFVEVEKIDSLEHRKVVLAKRFSPFFSSKDSVGRDQKVKIKLGGKDSIYQNHTLDGFFRIIHHHREVKSGYFTSLFDWEWHSLRAIRKSDDKTVYSNGIWIDDLILSFDGKFLLFESSQGYGEQFVYGFELFDFEKWQFTSFNFSEEYELSELAFDSKNDIVFKRIFWNKPSEFFKIRLKKGD